MASENTGKAGKTFTFDTIAVLLAAMENHGVSLGRKDYDLMSALDGKRGPDGFQHEFRAVKKRALELCSEVKAGKEFTPVKKSKGPTAKESALSKTESASTPPKKRSRGTKAKEESMNDADDESVEATGQEEQPKKKAKNSKQAPETPPRLVTPSFYEDLGDFGNVTPFDFEPNPDFAGFL